MNMYSWSYKVMKHLVTPEGRYRVTVPSDQVQGALRGAAELEAMSTRLVKESHYALTEASNSSNSVDDKTNETSLSATTHVAKDDAQSDETKATSNSETTSSPTPNVVSDTASVADLRAVAMKLKPATGELDELERVMLENFEILCFVLIEFWRQKLILCLKKSSSSTVPLAPIPNSTTAISSATQVDETNEV